MQIAHGTPVWIANVRVPWPLTVRRHSLDFLCGALGVFSKSDGISVALRHLPTVGSRQFGRWSKKSIWFAEDRPAIEHFRLVHRIEPTRHLAGQFHMRLLVLPHRHKIGLVKQDVGGHQHRIAQEAEVRQIPVRQILLLVLIGGHALQPADRRNHAQEQVELGVLEDLALQEEHTARGVEAGGQVVEHHVQGVGRNPRGVGVVRGQRVPVGDEEVALVLGGVLQLDPVGQGAHVVAQVELAGGAHAAEDARTRSEKVGFGHFACRFRGGAKECGRLSGNANKTLIPL